MASFDVSIVASTLGFLMKSITHVISGLNTGGAESFLLRLIQSLSELEHHVIALAPFGKDNLKDQFLPHVKSIKSFEMKRLDFLNFTKINALRKLLREQNPDVIQTWMYHGNLVGALGAKGLGIPVLWNIRNGPLEGENPKRLKLNSLTACVVKIGAMTSRWLPDKIITNSDAAKNLHIGWGYDEQKFEVIPNGIDDTIFKINPEARKKIRQKWGVSDQQKVIGFVGRFHPQKDFENLQKAIEIYQKMNSDVQFVLYGHQVSSENFALENLKKLNVKLMGRSDQMETIYPGFDLLTLTSAYGEAFPNVLVEAMAAGVPCVSTDVGDSAKIVQNWGVIVPRKKPEELACAWKTVLNQAWDAKKIHQSVVKRYAIFEIKNRYLDLYKKVLKNTSLKIA